MPHFVSPEHNNPLGSDRRTSDQWVDQLRADGANEDLAGASTLPKAKDTYQRTYQRVVTLRHKAKSPTRASASPNSHRPIPHFMQPIERVKKRKFSAESFLKIRRKLIGITIGVKDSSEVR